MAGSTVGRSRTDRRVRSSANYARRRSVRCDRGRGFDSRRLHEIAISRDFPGFPDDSRGIDVGIMTRQGIEIVSMHSNVDVPDPGAPGERLFSRDCAENLCRLPNKRKVRVLLNHFKSQSGGGGPKRARQAQGLRDIVDALVKSGEKNLVVMGDLNEGPDGQGNPPQHFAHSTPQTVPSSMCFRLPPSTPGRSPERSRAARRRTGSTTST